MQIQLGIWIFFPKSFSQNDLHLTSDFIVISYKNPISIFFGNKFGAFFNFFDSKFPSLRCDQDLCCQRNTQNPICIFLCEINLENLVTFSGWKFFHLGAIRISAFSSIIIANELLAPKYFRQFTFRSNGDSLKAKKYRMIKLARQRFALGSV